jgi:saccharopine dehydrogenase-like NADP-dependent oxidoreductase
VLVLGAGLVSKPLVIYLLEKGYRVTVASRTVSKAKALVQGFENGQGKSLNVNDHKEIYDFIQDSDLVISLVPYMYHVQIANICIKLKKNLVLTSYVSTAMQELDDAAKKAGILILNEIGLDPGIDHMSAMRIIHDVENRQGKIVSFQSYCGGLPALQNNNLPFGYKFSWSPRGVVLAGKNNGQFLENGRVVFIPSKNLFKNYVLIDIDGVGTFEAYTNRDALPYKQLYGLYDAHTVFRGTLRNNGWCYAMKKAQELGLFDDAKRDDLTGITWKQLICMLIGSENDENILEESARFLNLEVYSTVMKNFKWLGLFSNEPLSDDNSVMDAFCTLLQKKLQMAENESDLIILYHRIIAEFNGKEKLITSLLVNNGIPKGDSAMSRTVSLPAAIASALILEGKIKMTGVHIPVQPEIYNPVLDELAKLNIECVEKVIPID